MTTPMLPISDQERSTASGSHRKRWLIVLLIVVVLVVTVAWFRLDASRSAGTPVHRVVSAVIDDSLARAPSGVRVRVRVINTTRQRGLAKRATALLRDHGFDIVDFDSDPRTPRAATLIISHTGHDDWSRRIQRALGTGTFDVSSDTSHYIDVTVLLGDDWRPTAQSFRP